MPATITRSLAMAATRQAMTTGPTLFDRVEAAQAALDRAMAATTDPAVAAAWAELNAARAALVASLGPAEGGEE